MSLFNKTYLPQTELWLAKCSTKPTGKWAGALNTLIAGLVIDGNWQLLDRMWIFATETQANARIDIKSLSSLTEEPNGGTLTWTASKGYKGDGTNSYINSNYNPYTQGVNYTANSASAGAYMLTQGSSSLVSVFGVENNPSNWISLILSFNGVNLYGSINSNDAGGHATIYSTSSSSYQTSLISLVTTSSKVEYYYQKGIQIYGTTTTPSGNNAVPTGDVYLLASNTPPSGLIRFNPNTMSMAFFGSGNINQLKFYNRFQTFATTIGFNV